MRKLCIIFLLSSASVATAQNAISPSINHTLTSSNLQEEDLMAFEMRAVQKAGDLLELMDLALQIKQDTALRMEAARQAQAFFTSKECQFKVRADIEAIDLAHPEESEESISFQLSARYSLIKPTEDFVQVTPELFVGQLLFSSPNPKKHAYPDLNATVELRKVEKTFGEQTFVSWQVYFCDIKP